MNQIQKQEKNDFMVTDFEHTKRMCQMLMQTPHYRKMGEEGIFAVVEKAKSVGVNPMDALNGGMYYVQGKVEMTAAMMNQLIRAKKHSITKDKRSDDTVCILHGKRADNGDTWTESFSISDAEKAGIYRNQWLKYPKDMLFARALSRLARQLFPDVIKGCYVQGEIEQELTQIDSHDEAIEAIESKSDTISQEEFEHIEKMIGDDLAYRNCVMAHLKTYHKIEDLRDMPKKIYPSIIHVAEHKYNERKKVYVPVIEYEEEQKVMEV